MKENVEEIEAEEEPKNDRLKPCFSSRKHNWETPWDLFNKLDEMYSFVLDVCASKENAKCKTYISNSEIGKDGFYLDALKENWKEWLVIAAKKCGLNKDLPDLISCWSCWMNPPYKDVSLWVEKAYSEALTHGVNIVCLLPARTDTRWWHSFIYDETNGFKKGVEVTFLKGRVKFVDAKGAAPFPSCIVVFDGKEMKQ